MVAGLICWDVGRGSVSQITRPAEPEHCRTIQLAEFWGGGSRGDLKVKVTNAGRKVLEGWTHAQTVRTLVRKADERGPSGQERLRRGAGSCWIPGGWRFGENVPHADPRHRAPLYPLRWPRGLTFRARLRRGRCTGLLCSGSVP